MPRDRALVLSRRGTQTLSIWRTNMLSLMPLTFVQRCERSAKIIGRLRIGLHANAFPSAQRSMGSTEREESCQAL